MALSPIEGLKQDWDNIKLLVDLQKQGLLTTDEANMVMRGATI
jgi:hypothetical protein